jgi:hypothetical protein
MPVPTSGLFRTQAGNGLTLHVGAHQRAVRVIMLKERNQRSRNRNNLCLGATSMYWTSGGLS